MRDFRRVSVPESTLLQDVNPVRGNAGFVSRRVSGRLADVITRVVQRKPLAEEAPQGDLRYWLSRTPDERIGAVEALRRQYYGSSDRLQRCARAVPQA